MRRILPLIILIAFCTQKAFADSQVIETRLSNGLLVLTKEVHSAPVFNLMVWYRLGSSNENIGQTGMTHLLEHMLFKGTKNFQKGEMTKLIKSRGGLYNGATWLDYTNYWTLMSSEHLDLALRIEADRMVNAIIDPLEFKSEMVVVRSELEGRENNPGILLYKEFVAAAYRQHPYRWPIIGWRSDVEGITRDEVYQYYKDYYGPNNAILVLVGDFDTQTALSLIKTHFGKLPKAKPVRPIRTIEQPQKGERRIELNGKGSSHRILIGFHTVNATHPDSYPLAVMDQILSGGRSSRMYQSLVENGLAVSAWSSIMPTKYPSLFSLGAVGASGITSSQLEKSILAEIEKIKSEPVSDEELERAKKQIEAYFIFNNDSVSDQAEQLGFFEIVSSWKMIDQYLPNINKVTKEDILRVARKYLTSENRTIASFIPTERGVDSISTPILGPAHYEHENFSSTLVKDRNTKAFFSKKSKTKNIKPFRKTLENGLVLIVQENHSNKTISIRGYVNAGSYFDPPERLGVSALTANMLERGTLARSSLDIAKAIENTGGSISIEHGIESVRFQASMLTRDFSIVVALLADQLRNPVFPEDQLEKLKNEVISRLIQEKENPDALASRALYNRLFPQGHPYHKQTLEQQINSIKSITRDDLVQFHKLHYGPKGACIVIVGDVDPKTAETVVNEYFGTWTGGSTVKPVIPDVAMPNESSTLSIKIQDKSETSILFGHPCGIKRNSPEYYAYVVMNHILGGGGALSSKLGDIIRDKMGLAYDVYSTFDATLGQGLWYASIGVNPGNVQKAVDALKTTITEYHTKGQTKQEFEQAKQFLIGYFPVGLETNSGVARVLMNAEFYGLGLDYIQRYPEIYNSITLEQVKSAAKKYLHPDKALLVIAGP